MIEAGTPCPLCKTPLAETRLPDVAWDEGPIRLTLRALPVLACEAPHRYFLGQGFFTSLRNALVGEELAKIPAGKEKGRLFRKYTCGGCGAILPDSGSEPWTYSSSLAWEETPGFVVDVTVPVFCCASCGREQARSGAELAKLLPVALVHALKAAGLKTPG